ncbi:myoD family inhibitor domain-containing protein 2-like isoform X2 [Heteronotia binoei]|uniref:myoD family inhibitor domain-containing protein 2-like isoform X2 n=1 Tax=Heteronotia binoei TaxID=13085 RepID=UPI00292DD4DC|nr:myoD family inhibitor domain-containing protein 2-like isoform X2 [Heteronotia binoei]
MSAVNSDAPGGTEGRNAEPSKGPADSPKATPGSELPCPTSPGITSFPFQQGKVPLHPVYANGFRVPPSSVKQQPPPGKQRVSSTASVCSKSSQKSCKSTASQIQEVAGDDLCATLLLACLFCRFSDLLALLPGCFCSCPPLQGCNSMLLGLCSDPRCCCCCCCCYGSDGAVLECCYQTGDCLELALEISEMCYH